MGVDVATWMATIGRYKNVRCGNEKQRSWRENCKIVLHIQIPVYEPHHMNVKVLLFALVVTPLMLILSGDVEPNPGPYGQHGEAKPDQHQQDDSIADGFENVDNRELGEDDFLDIKKAVMDLVAVWKDFGSALGVPPTIINAVSEANPNDPRQCQFDILHKWFRKDYNYQKYGPPSWRTLVKAVGSSVGGRNPALAEKIARTHPVSDAVLGDQITSHVPCTSTPEEDYDDLMDTDLGEDDFQEVRDAVGRDLDGVWRDFGSALGISASAIKGVAEAHPGDPGQCLFDILHKWVRKDYNYQKFGPPSWRALVNTVGSSSGGRNPTLAKRIALKHPKAKTSMEVYIKSKCPEFTMPKFLYHFNEGLCWCNKENIFYTSLQDGYKLCLEVNAAGTGRWAGKYISIGLHLMKGDLDDVLPFPFYGEITVQLVNIKNNNHIEKEFIFDDKTKKAGARAPADQDMNKESCDIQDFATVEEIYQQFLMNDSIVFRVIKIVMKENKNKEEETKERGSLTVQNTPDPSSLRFYTVKLYSLMSIFLNIITTLLWFLLILLCKGKDWLTSGKEVHVPLEVLVVIGLYWYFFV